MTKSILNPIGTHLIFSVWQPVDFTPKSCQNVFFPLFLIRKLVQYIRQPSFRDNFKYLTCLICENEPHYPEHWQYKLRNRIASFISFCEIYRKASVTNLFPGKDWWIWHFASTSSGREIFKMFNIPCIAFVSFWFELQVEFIFVLECLNIFLSSKTLIDFLKTELCPRSQVTKKDHDVFHGDDKSVALKIFQCTLVWTNLSQMTAMPF